MTDKERKEFLDLFKRDKCRFHDCKCDSDDCRECEHNCKDNEPKEFKWEIEPDYYGDMPVSYMPICPSCGEPMYDENECLFCKQKLLPSKFKQIHRQEVTGFTEDNKCNKCGEYNFKCIMHADGREFYTWRYECRNCGNIAEIKTWREGKLVPVDSEVEE